MMDSRISAKPQVVDIHVQNGRLAETPNSGQYRFQAKPQAVDTEIFLQAPFSGHFRAGMFLI